MTKAAWQGFAVMLFVIFAGCDSDMGRANAPAAQAMTVPSVHHILLEVADLDRSVAFYRDQLGLRLASRSDDFATLESANVGVYLWQSRWDWEAPPRAEERKGLGMYPHFAVPDVQAMVARLGNAGYRIVQQPRNYDWGTEAFVADPDGFTWAIVNMAPRQDHH